MAAKATRSSRTKSGCDVRELFMLIFLRAKLQVAGIRSALSAR